MWCACFCRSFYNDTNLYSLVTEHIATNNLPKLITQQRGSQESNAWSSSCKSNAPSHYTEPPRITLVEYNSRSALTLYWFLGSDTASVRAFCFGCHVCLSSVICLSCNRSRKLSQTGAKFHHLYRKSRSLSKNMMWDFALEVTKYPKSSYFMSVQAYCYALLVMQLVSACIILGDFTVLK